jgi:hypothetical protein
MKAKLIERTTGRVIDETSAAVEVSLPVFVNGRAVGLNLSVNFDRPLAASKNHAILLEPTGDELVISGAEPPVSAESKGKQP